MKLIEKGIKTTESYFRYLPEWINGLKKLNFLKGKYLNTSEKTFLLLQEHSQDTEWITSSIFKEVTNYPGGEKIIFFIQIWPFIGDEEYPGIWVYFCLNNVAYFQDMHDGYYSNYFDENNINSHEELTWQEAYNKLHELATKEDVLVPKMSQ